jgi:hypothetical protein
LLYLLYSAAFEAYLGAQFTCFISTTVQRLALFGPALVYLLYLLYFLYLLYLLYSATFHACLALWLPQFTCFTTSAKVHILTQEEERSAAFDADLAPSLLALLVQKYKY